MTVLLIRPFSNRLNICKLGVNHKHNRLKSGWYEFDLFQGHGLHNIL